MFRTCDNKGFQIQFSNGYTVSCQFGTMNYCERRDFDDRKIFCERNMNCVQSNDCEVAVINPEEKFVTGKIIDDMKAGIGSDDMVAGWVSADDVGKIIAYVSKLN